MSDAQPDWGQTNPEQPDFIKNKELAERFRPIVVDGEIFLDDSYKSGSLNIVSGDNIVLRIVNGALEVAATNPEQNLPIYDIVSERQTNSTMYYLTKDNIEVGTPIVVPDAYDDTTVIEQLSRLEKSLQAQEQNLNQISGTLAKKIETASIKHTSDSSPIEGCIVSETALEIIVDSYTKQEVRDYVAEAIQTITGGESAGEVLALLNQHVAVYEAEIAKIDERDKQQDDLITKLNNQVEELVNDIVSDIPVATSDAVGGIRSATNNIDSTTAVNKVYIDASTGVGEVKAFSTDNLVQGTQMLILNGGDIDIVI